MQENKKTLTIPYFKSILINKFERKIISELSEKYEIVLYGGFNNNIMNSGRFQEERMTKKLSEDIKSLGNIKIGATLSNHIFDERVFEDEMIANYDEIILRDYKLLHKLQDDPRFKNTRLKFSITGHPIFVRVSNPGFRDAIKRYYRRLFNDFDIVVIHSELIPKQWFYNFLIKEGYIDQTEIIINIIKGCNNCPRYPEHYKLISEGCRSKEVDTIYSCLLDPMPKNFTSQAIPDSGKDIFFNRYRNIKFEGRTLSSFTHFIKVHPYIKEIYEKL